MEEIRRVNVTSIDYLHAVMNDIVLDIELSASQGKGWGWLASNGERLYWDVPVPVEEKKDSTGRLYMDMSKRQQYLKSRGTIFEYLIGIFADEQRPIRQAAIIANSRLDYTLVRFIDGIDLFNEAHEYLSAPPIGAPFVEFADYIVQNMGGYPPDPSSHKESQAVVFASSSHKDELEKDRLLPQLLRKPTVFISYSHADSQFVNQLADQLKASGVDVWIDKWKIRVGDSITHKINEGIGTSDWLIVVLSCASVKSKWVTEELSAATIRNVEQDKHAFILPALIEECEIPTLLQHRKYANFKDHPEEAFQELLEVIQPIKPFDPEMVLIPAGEFLMGSDPTKDKDAQENEQPQHKLYLPNYYIAKTPVTNAEYVPFVQATGHRVPEHWKGDHSPEGREEHPVVNISWHDALAYCNWLAEVTGKPYRLPSEAEWEKAARGTDGRIYPWGNDPPDKRRCNFGNNVGRTTPAGQYSPHGHSPYGCVDMAGNVWEWCHSLYKPYPYDAKDGREDPKAEDIRVLRGGAVFDTRRFVRCASRSWYGPLIRHYNLGFRVVVAPGYASSH